MGSLAKLRLWRSGGDRGGGEGVIAMHSRFDFTLRFGEQYQPLIIVTVRGSTSPAIRQVLTEALQGLLPRRRLHPATLRIVGFAVSGDNGAPRAANP